MRGGIMKMSWKKGVPGLFRRVLTAACLLCSVACQGGSHSMDASFLASWSPEGSRVAVSRFPFEVLQGRRPPASGIWVIEFPSGRMRLVAGVRSDRWAFHAQWSPFGEQISFVTLEWAEGKPKKTGEFVHFDVWIASSDGRALRKVASSRCREEQLLFPGFLLWGPSPDLVLYPAASGTGHTAILHDLSNSQTRAFLPRGGELYSLRVSPMRSRIALLLFDPARDRTDLYVSEFQTLAWRWVAAMPISANEFEDAAGMMSWSPDGSKLLVAEEMRSGPNALGLRVFEVAGGRSRRLPAGAPNTSFFWSPDGSAIAWSGDVPGTEGGRNAAFRIDIRTGGTAAIAEGEALRVLSWNAAEDRIYFLGGIPDGEGGEETELNSIFSCRSDGSDVRRAADALPEQDMLWSTSPRGNRALLFMESAPVILLDLAYGSMEPACCF